MEFIRDNAMKFNPNTHNHVEKTINDVNFRSAVWIKDHRTAELVDHVPIILSVETGAARIGVSLNADDIHSLIDMLNLTLDNIKAAELELLALQTKAAA